jgi:hypothetical protein
MPRFVQSSVVSSVPSTRRRSGTGSIPQLGVSCKSAGSVPATVRRASLVLLVSALALAGCGSAPKDVTKAQYEQHLQTIGDNLYKSANALGQSTATGVFNENVQKLQDTIDNAAGDLNGLRPPGAEAQAANKQLVHAYGDLADEFDKVKEARRESYPKAIVALTAVQRSQPARQSIRAAMRLRRLGFKVPVSATIGSGA